MFRDVRASAPARPRHTDVSRQSAGAGGCALRHRGHQHAGRRGPAGLAVRRGAPQVHRRVLRNWHAQALRERDRDSRPRDRHGDADDGESERTGVPPRRRDLPEQLRRRWLDGEAPRLPAPQGRQELRRRGHHWSEHHPVRRRCAADARIHRAARDQRRESLGAAGSTGTDVRKVDLVASLRDQLGSGAKANRKRELRNVGPSISYKLRDASGQAREYNNYMLPVELDGQRVYLLGTRDNPNDSMRYLRVPADDSDSIVGWMRLRRALLDPALREQAASRYVALATPTDKPEMAPQLQTTALRVLALFAGADSSAACVEERRPAGRLGLHGVQRARSGSAAHLGGLAAHPQRQPLRTAQPVAETPRELPRSSRTKRPRPS